MKTGKRLVVLDWVPPPVLWHTLFPSPVCSLRSGLLVSNGWWVWAQRGRRPACNALKAAFVMLLAWTLTPALDEEGGRRWGGRGASSSSVKQGRESVPVSAANHTTIEALQLSHIQKSRLVTLLETVTLELKGHEGISDFYQLLRAWRNWSSTQCNQINVINSQINKKVGEFSEVLQNLLKVDIIHVRHKLLIKNMGTVEPYRSTIANQNNLTKQS